MTTPELPPLSSDLALFHALLPTDERDTYWRVINSIEARERILLARIAELEAVLARFDERWIMDGELGFCTACGVSIEGGESHKPECWLAEARAAIDAARKA